LLCWTPSSWKPLKQWHVTRRIEHDRMLPENVAK
jgi:hypothetical protein